MTTFAFIVGFIVGLITGIYAIGTAIIIGEEDQDK